MNHPLKKGPALPKDEGLAFPRHAVPGKTKSESRYPAPPRRSSPPKESKGELQKVLKRLETEFNRRIRARDQAQGRFQCVSCREVLPVAVMEAGHFQRKGHEKLRFDPRNVHGQCHRCNCELSGNRAAYRLTMVEMYGEAEVQAIEARKGVGGRLRLDEARALLLEVMAGKVVT